MLATVVVVPGGLVLLIALALALLAMRTARGQRLLIPFKRRVPPRVRAQAKRILALVTGEKLFLPGATTVHPA